MHTDHTLVAAKWRAEILAWADTWPESGLVMPSGRRRSAFRLLRACMGLAQLARADGKLKVPVGNYWNIKQLAAEMGMAHSTAEDTLRWLEGAGRLTKTRGTTNEYGRGTDMRCLVLTEACGQESSSTLALGVTPTSLSELTPKSGGANANSTLESNANGELERWPTRLSSLSSLSSLHSLDEDVAKATGTNGLTSKQRKERAQRFRKDSEKALRHSNDAPVLEVAL
jgi:hypothetical protein